MFSFLAMSQHFMEFFVNCVDKVFHHPGAKASWKQWRLSGTLWGSWNAMLSSKAVGVGELPQVMNLYSGYRLVHSVSKNFRSYTMFWNMMLIFGTVCFVEQSSS